IEERQIIEKTQEFGCSDSLTQYMFIVPWISLNEKNYDSYLKFDPKNKVKLLHHILAGNLLSISKSLGYVVLNQIKVRTKLSPIKVYSKGIPLIGFEGEFQINFMIPEYLGIGKSVSRGFGVARKCNL
ncbi:MAG: CRISPR-associated endonuclease Cas6, partial [Candidatus Methanoperedens sp.]|nr:CRISPR-associated endonuclease Cas6 [Candidatus Methanoperedens sp.]